jgi:hypothetical protein
VTLKAGILIIGSLYWDRKPHREAWRRANLDMENEFSVTAPIRYGRRSSARGNTFTMVFSLRCAPGVAKVLPCKKPVASVGDLVTEAKALWAAEQKDEENVKSVTGISGAWGRVALLCNERLPDAARNEYVGGWADQIRQMGYNPGKAAPDGAVINSEGLLQIAWPSAADTGLPAPVDFLLATATSHTIDPATNDYYSVREIAGAWNADRNNRVEYFDENRKAGIRTFQDGEIAKALIPRRG